ncbi:hypothetical protein BH09MYX1_BH09MYX1_32290 [soil metagenome]
MRSALRIAFAVLAATIVWLAAREAHAAAPQCDERGATTFAKSPLLEVSNASIDIGEDCNIPVPKVDDLSYEDGRGSLPDFSGSLPQSTLPYQIGIIAPASAVLSFTPSPDSHGPQGVFQTVDRPPRS